MKWLQGNPVGMALTALSGLFALLALGMAIVWTLPVRVEVLDNESGKIDGIDSILVAGEVGALRDYDVINERPVFNESRRPEIEEDIDDSLDDEIDVSSIAVAEVPDIRLTGIIITPGVKIASLTPADSGKESVMAYEGESLIGEYVGWQVSAVHPRNVTLESRDGRTLELELLVHDATIKEPPKPIPAAPVEQANQSEAGQDGGVGEDDEPLSRAEQIRQRIAERREELRREQEEQDNGQASNPGSGANAYQNAIRNKIRRNSKDQASDENEDG